MSGWQDYYESGAFSIDTDQPSGLVQEFASAIPAQSRIVDLGCGAGRNAIFLASQGHKVEAYDIVDLGWHKNIPDELRDRIEFHQVDLASIALAEQHGAALMMRLLQYLSPEELQNLIPKVAAGLMAGGLAVSSFIVTGASDKSEYGIINYVHDPFVITQQFEQVGLTPITIRIFDTTSQHIPFRSEINVCELVLRK